MKYFPDSLKAKGLDIEGWVFPEDMPPYNPDLVEFARQLRSNGTKAEAMLWKVLKNSQTGYKFTRQRPIMNYIADFYCPELNVVVEVDGFTHFSAEDRAEDQERDRKMRLLDIRIVRLEDSAVRKNPTVEAQRIFFELGMEVPDL